MTTLLRLLACLAILLCPAIVHALGNQVQWSVGPAGSDLNGGGCDLSIAGGTCYSNQDGPQWSGTDGIPTGGTGTFDSASGGGSAFDATTKGNVLVITAVVGGTCSATPIYTVVQSHSSATRITVSPNPCTVTPTSVTFRIGGRLQLLATALALVTTPDQGLWIQKGTYTTAAGFSTTSPGSSQGRTWYRGFNVTYGDDPTPASGNQPVIQASGGSPAIVLTQSQSAQHFESMTIDCNALGVIGFRATGFSGLRNVWVKGCTGDGIGVSGTTSLGMRDVEVSGNNTASGTAGINCGTQQCWLTNSWVHGNTKAGVFFGQNSFMWGSVISGNTTYCMQIDATFNMAHSICYANVTDGIQIQNLNSSGPSRAGAYLLNMISDSNGGYGLDVFRGSPQDPSRLWFNNNAYRNNTTGDMFQNTAQNYDILNATMTGGSPFKNAGSNDFRINNTASAGRLLRGTGTPSKLPGLPSQTSYPDIGVYQHLDGEGAGARGVIGG